MPYSPPWQEQEEDGEIQQDRDGQRGTGWSNRFTGEYGAEIGSWTGDPQAWMPKLDTFEYDPDIRTPGWTPSPGDDDEEEDLLVPESDEVGVEYSFPEEEAVCGD